MIHLLTTYYGYTREEAMQYEEYQGSPNGDVLEEFFSNLDNGGEPVPINAS